MTATDIAQIQVPDDPDGPDDGDRWRGRVQDLPDDDAPLDENLPRRREARTLLASVLRPFRAAVTLRAFQFRY
jgi:hypothetical protein